MKPARRGLDRRVAGGADGAPVRRFISATTSARGIVVDAVVAVGEPKTRFAPFAVLVAPDLADAVGIGEGSLVRLSILDGHVVIAADAAPARGELLGQSRVTRVPRGFSVRIPREVAVRAGLDREARVQVALVGRQLVVERADGQASEVEFKRAYSGVLRRHGPVFRALAAYDRVDGDGGVG